MRDGPQVVQDPPFPKHCSTEMAGSHDLVRAMRWSSLFVLMVLLSAPGYGQLCQTVANGSIEDPEVWDCGCAATSCDTLIISHDILVQENLGTSILDQRHIEITATGSVICVGDIVLYGTLTNSGSISGERLVCFGSGNVLNQGSISGDYLLFNCDTIFNQNSVIAIDTVATSYTTRLYNSGEVRATHCQFLSQVANWGLIETGTLFAQRNVYNAATVTSQGLVDLRSLSENFGTMACGHLHQVSGTLVNRGSITINGDLVINESVSAELETGSTVLTRNMLALEDSHLTGPGSICILEHAENHGLLEAVRICDLSPTITEPPYLDVHAGQLMTMLPIYYCNATTCATVDVSEADPSAGANLYPNPSTGLVQMELAQPAAAVRSWVLLDALGRRVMGSRGTFQGSLSLDLTGHGEGSYWLELRVADGTVMERVRLVIMR